MQKCCFLMGSIPFLLTNIKFAKFSGSLVKQNS